MASLTQWTWVWANSRRWWRTGKPGVLQSKVSQRVGHNWVPEQQQQNMEWVAVSSSRGSFWPFHDRNGPMQSTWLAYFLREWYHITGHFSEILPPVFQLHCFQVLCHSSTRLAPAHVSMSSHILAISFFLCIKKLLDILLRVTPTGQIFFHHCPSEPPVVRTSCWNDPPLSNANISSGPICTPGLNCSFSSSSSLRP